MDTKLAWFYQINVIREIAEFCILALGQLPQIGEFWLNFFDEIRPILHPEARNSKTQMTLLCSVVHSAAEHNKKSQF